MLQRGKGEPCHEFVNISFSGGLEDYRREGSKYVQRLLSRQKKGDMG